jgi:hypothetical protein
VDWESQISDGLQASSFLIVILTPAFLQSEWCCREVGLFGKHETTLGRGDLIFPIHYIDIGDINPNNSSECFDKSIYELIHRHQLSDFRALRFKDPDSEEISRKIESVALAIRRALRHQRLAESKNDALPGSSESANPLDTSSKIKNIGRKNPMIENVKAFVSSPELNGYQSDRDKDKIVQRARAVSLLLSKSIAYLVWLVLLILLVGISVMAFSDKTAPGGVGILFLTILSAYCYGSYKAYQKWGLRSTKIVDK